MAARPEPPGPNLPGWHRHSPLPRHAHMMVTGGMPGWQISFIAVGSALKVAVLAVTVNRMRAAQQGASATTT